MKTSLVIWKIVFAVFCCILLSSSLLADDAADGRAICSKMGDAVVRVEAVQSISIDYDGDSDEYDRKSETVGTVVDPAGITIVSLSAIDNSRESSMYSETSQIKELKIVISDGKEMPAKVVLRDQDLDLAVIVPTQKPDTPMAFVNLKDSAKADILDRVLVVTRLGKIADRALSANIEQVQSIVEKPRRFYVVSLENVGEEFGAPVLAMSGKAIGIVLLKSRPSGSEDALPVVLSAEDILSVVAQIHEGSTAQSTE